MLFSSFFLKEKKELDIECLPNSIVSSSQTTSCSRHFRGRN